MIVAEDNHDVWLAAVEGLEWEREGGERCDVCYRVRLEDTAREAEARGFDYFASTLTISPHKDRARIGAVGQRATQGKKVQFLDEDFKKRDGFHRSVVLSRDLGLYRQKYCGCEFSLRDRDKGQKT
jgi:predicted adenine nucleotide alpha hydrolase (AANH) superfamily ATPase